MFNSAILATDSSHAVQSLGDRIERLIFGHCSQDSEDSWICLCGSCGDDAIRTSGLRWSAE